MQHYTYLVGNVGSDIRIGTASNGSQWASFRLAVSDSYRLDDGSYKSRPTTWYDVKVWRSWAPNLAQSLTKGQRVIVIGRVYMDRWESENGSGERLTIQAHAVGPDLAFGVAVFKALSLTAEEREKLDRPAQTEGPSHEADSPWRHAIPGAGTGGASSEQADSASAPDSGGDAAAGDAPLAGAGAGRQAEPF